MSRQTIASNSWSFARDDTSCISDSETCLLASESCFIAGDDVVLTFMLSPSDLMTLVWFVLLLFGFVSETFGWPGLDGNSTLGTTTGTVGNFGAACDVLAIVSEHGGRWA